MRFLANENFPSDAVALLRELQHDVCWIRTDDPGATDPQVLVRAIQEDRVLLTFDKDFGELAFRSNLPATCGIVLVRLRAATSGELAKLVASAIQSREDWAGKFSVVEPGRIRMRSLPG
jgi:predicted nuclease of predicted toxin-antitoxin system